MPSIKDSLSNYHTNNEKKAFFITDSIYDLTYNSTVMIADWSQGLTIFHIKEHFNSLSCDKINSYYQFTNTSKSSNSIKQTVGTIL